MIVTVERVRIPAMSTIGYGTGRDEHGNLVEFVGDHRPMRDLGDALQAKGEPIEVEVAGHQITRYAGLRGPWDSSLEDA